MKLRNWILTGALIAANLTSLTSANLDNIVGEKTKKEKKSEITIKQVPFQEYNPETNKKTIKLEDALLQEYINNPRSTLELDNSIMSPYLMQLNAIETITIDNYHAFKKNILSTAEELGYDKKDIKRMSIKDAISLSGKLVAYKLEYYEEMIVEDTILNGLSEMDKVKVTIRKGLNGVDLRNDEAIRIDEASEDIIFEEGNGVCRNYAGVNTAVFNVLKDINLNLKNTYMRYYSPDDIGHAFSLPHAWNVVFTMEKTNTGINIETTYVDPTWLDTRKQTTDNTGKQQKIEDEDIYNALDEAHFSRNNIFADICLADLYSALGNDERTNYFAQKNRISEDKVSSFKEKAFNSRMVVLENLQEMVNEDTNSADYASYKFANEMAKAIELVSNENIGIIMDGLYEFTENMDQEDINKLNETYETFLEKVPSFKNEQIPYLSIGEGSNWDIKYENATIKNIFDKLLEKTKSNQK